MRALSQHAPRLGPDIKPVLKDNAANSEPIGHP